MRTVIGYDTLPKLRQRSLAEAQVYVVWFSVTLGLRSRSALPTGERCHYY